MGTNSAAFIGLTNNPGKREQAQRDLQTLGSLLALKRQNEADEAAAQEAEDQYYAQLREQADQMLEGDRAAINEKVKSLQGDVKEKIRLYGGSKRKFMAGGGQSVLSNYTRSILDSDEVFQYKQNKINLERILDAKAKGLGHLLAPQDEMALQNYYENGRGEITYSGLLNEIELPPSNQFDYGHRTTPMEVLLHGSNKQKLLANYMIEHPDSGIENLSEKERTSVLASYAQSKGYSQKGTHVDPYRNQRQSGRSASGDKYDPSKARHSVSGSVGYILDNDREVNIHDIDANTFRKEGFVDAIIGNNFESEWGHIGENTNITDDALFPRSLGTIGVFNLLDSDNRYRLRGARKLSNNYDVPTFNAVTNGQFESEGNVIKDFTIEPYKNLAYSVDGTPMKIGGSKLLKKMFGSGKRDVKILSTGIGWESQMADGNKRLIVDAMNEKGEIDTELTSQLYQTEEGVDDPTAHPIMVMMFEYETPLAQGGGKKNFYMKVPMTGQASKLALQKNYEQAGIDDLGLVKEEETAKNTIEQQSQSIAQAETYVEDTSVNNPIFGENLFQMQNRNYNLDPKGKRRENLRRAFYLTASYFDPNTELGTMIEQDAFGKVLQATNGLSVAKSGKVNDKQLIDYISKNLSYGDPDANNDFRNMMMMFLSKINNPQSK